MTQKAARVLQGNQKTDHLYIISPKGTKTIYFILKGKEWLEKCQANCVMQYIKPQKKIFFYKHDTNVEQYKDTSILGHSNGATLI